MENHTTNGPVAPRRGSVDHAAWAKNQVLADELAAAKARVAEAERAGAGPLALRRSRRSVDAAAERLYVENRGIARRAARSYLGRSHDQEELYAVADEALWKAIVGWDPARSPLANWAFRTVEKACRVHVARIEHGLTAWAWSHRPAVRDAVAVLEAAGSVVDAGVVAEMAGCTPELAMTLMRHEFHGRPRSLDAVVGDDGATLAELIDVEQDVVQIDDIDQLAVTTSGVETAHLALWLRFHGLDGASPWTTKGLEQTFGVSDETVRRRVRAVDAHVVESNRTYVPGTSVVGDAGTEMSATIAGLRQFASSRGAAPTLSTVQTIVNFLKGAPVAVNGRELMFYFGPEQLGAELGLSVDEVCDLVVSLGTFLGQSLKTSNRQASAWNVDAPTALVSATGLGSLPNDSGDQLSLLPFHSGDRSVLFAGWESSVTGRNLGQAVPNIVQADIDDGLLNRWMLRQWADPAVVVSFELVALVWTLARLGRAGELVSLATLARTGQPSLARALADAWDLLDVSRAVAVESVDRLCAGGQDAADVLAEVSRCRWLNEAEVGRLERAAQRVVSGEPTGALPSAVAQFAVNASGCVGMRPSSVAELSDGQVRRLAESSGLATDGDVSLRRELNVIVADAGLRADADRLIGLGVAAHRAGLSELFATALERRRNGEVGWADDLHEQLGV